MSKNSLKRELRNESRYLDSLRVSGCGEVADGGEGIGLVGEAADGVGRGAVALPEVGGTRVPLAELAQPAPRLAPRAAGARHGAVQARGHVRGTRRPQGSRRALQRSHHVASLLQRSVQGLKTVQTITAPHSTSFRYRTAVAKPSLHLGFSTQMPLITAQRCRSETEKFILDDLFTSL